MNIDYVLDSSFWLEYFNGTDRGKKAAKIIADFDLATPITAIAELADKFHREKIDFKEFLDFIKLNSVIIQLTEDIVISAPSLKMELRKKHPDASLTDGIHLATARSEKGILITTDRDFSGCEGVEII